MKKNKINKDQQHQKINMIEFPCEKKILGQNNSQRPMKTTLHSHDKNV